MSEDIIGWSVVAAIAVAIIAAAFAWKRIREEDTQSSGRGTEGREHPVCIEMEIHAILGEQIA